MNVSQKLLDRCQQTPSSDSFSSAKRCLLDTLGVWIKGSTYPSMSPLRQFLDGYREMGPSSALGFGFLPAVEAALYNGTAAHSVEMDDFHRSAAVHPGVVVIPAALAVAEEIGASGESVLKAILYGYEAMVRLGELCHGMPYKKGFHPTSLCGVFGASVAASSLYQLPRQKAIMALGIAGNSASGLLEYKSNGSWTKRLNAGWAARTGVVAAQLAKAGFTGPESIMEGRFGFLQAFADRSALSRINWDRQEGWACDEISFKPYASCRFTHAPIDALLKICQDHQLRPGDIEQIQVKTHQMAIAATFEPKERKYNPKETVDAQFSIPYCLALAAVYGQVPPDYFDEKHLQKEEILHIASKVAGGSDPKYTELFPSQNGSRVEVTARGQVYTAEVLHAKGDPENPIGQEVLENKFRMLTGGWLSFSQQEEIISLVADLEKQQNIHSLMEIMR